MKITEAVKKMLDENEKYKGYKVFSSFYDLSFIKTLTLDQADESSIARDCILLLQSNLYRSRMLAQSFIDGLNNKNPFTCALAARAHFEITGVLTYMLKKYKRFLNGEINQEEFEEIVSRLQLGTKDKLEDLATPNPINAMTLVDSVDQFSKTFGYIGIRSMYDLLSEFCHPNNYGYLFASQFNSETKQYTFREIDDSYDREGGMVYHLNTFFISCHIYLIVYNELKRYIELNEKIPFTDYEKFDVLQALLDDYLDMLGIDLEEIKRQAKQEE